MHVRVNGPASFARWGLCERMTAGRHDIVLLSLSLSGFAPHPIETVAETLLEDTRRFCLLLGKDPVLKQPLSHSERQTRLTEEVSSDHRRSDGHAVYS